PPVSSRTMSTSTPSGRSALSGDRSTRAGNTATGRRFAYTPSCARNASRPNSGLKWRGAWSSEGSPTAPSNTASARATAARVSSTAGALAPVRSPRVNSALRISHSQFESCNPGFLAQRASDLIRSREQHLPAVGLHGERGAEPEAVVHALLFEIDGELILAACGLMAAEQLGDLLRQESHGDEPVLTAVREEDVRERRREDRAEAVLAEGPDSVLARRAAAEVL